MVVMISEMGFTLSKVKPTLNGSTEILNNHLVEWALTLSKNLLLGKGTYEQNSLTQVQAQKYTGAYGSKAEARRELWSHPWIKAPHFWSKFHENHILMAQSRPL